MVRQIFEKILFTFSYSQERVPTALRAPSCRGSVRRQHFRRAAGWQGEAPSEPEAYAPTLILRQNSTDARWQEGKKTLEDTQARSARAPTALRAVH